MKMYDWLDQELATRDYLAGDEFSNVDITGYSKTLMRKAADADFGDHRTNLRAWHDRIVARPSVQTIRGQK